MGLVFHQKFYNLPKMVVVTSKLNDNHIECIVEATPENVELLLNDNGHEAGYRQIHLITPEFFDEKISNGYKVMEELKKKREE